MAESGNGDNVRAEAQRVRDHLRAAGSAASDAIRDNASAAADAARARARGASAWARSRFSDLQDQVEQRPGTAAMWALGIGLIAGILLTSLVRSRDD
jgi:hypothetical protein